MRKVVFILNQISQPRCIKRIESFQKYNIPYDAWGFDKKLYNKNLDNQVISINKFDYNPKIKKKIENFVRRWMCIHDLIKNSGQNDIFYLFGFDVALFAVLSLRKIRYIYEESDITYARRNKVLFYLLQYIDKRIRSNSLLTVFTSEGFLYYFYDNKHIPNNILVQSNKLHNSLANTKRSISFVEDINRIKFGFIGYIRYNTIFNFAKTIGEYFSNHEFHFWGDSIHTKEIKNIVNKYSNIYFHGSFMNPDDLKRIYSKIDILVACYDTTNFNTRVAEPNKLYEAILFCKPIIVSTDTYVEKKVLELNVGYSVNALSIQAIKDFVDTLNSDELNRISEAEYNISTDKLIDNPNQITEKVIGILKSL